MTHTDGKQAWFYGRVSTDDQVEGMSLPSQEREADRIADERHYTIIARHVEPGVSGKDTGRPAFGAMLADVFERGRPGDAIITTDQSRFARNHEVFVSVCSKLAKHGIVLEHTSGTNRLDRDSRFSANIVSLVHQKYSDDAAAHTARAMRENARAGFHNGGPCPLGYASVVAEVRDGKAKKKLIVDPAGAAIIREAFDRSDPLNGPVLGNRALADHLNEKGYRKASGKPFYCGDIDRILHNPRYTGRFPACTKDGFGNPLPEKNWVWAECPPIISQAQFDRVGANKAKNAPSVTPPQESGGSTLLTGIAHCAVDGCTDKLVTTTGGSGRHSYYTCRKKTNRRAASCSSKSIPRAKLDNAVLDALSERLLEPAALRQALGALIDVSEKSRTEKKSELVRLRKARDRALQGQHRLLDMVREGVMDMRDQAMSQQLAALKSELVQTESRISVLEKSLQHTHRQITDGTLARFAETLKRKLQTGDPRAKKALVGALISRVNVGKRIEISGPKAPLAAAIAAGAPQGGGVPIFDRKWCRLRDSNT